MSFSLKINNSDKPIVRGWLILGISALALAGSFAILLVLARTPYFQAIIPFKDFFRTALIVHVNLSVLVWLLSFTCMLWAMLGAKNRLALGFSAIGAILFSFSPFIGDGNPLMNNYVPILQNSLFLFGIGLFGLGVTIQVIHTLFHLMQENWQLNKEKLAIYSTSLITAMAIMAFLWSYNAVSAIKETFDTEQYYELIFWGGGHILQIVYTQIMLIAWLWLASSIGIPLPNSKIIIAVFIIGILITIPFPIPYLRYEITDFGYLNFFTRQMQHGGGISSGILGLLLFFVFIRYKSSPSPEKNALIWSFILFTCGGLIGISISGENTSIPAHYHGSIVGITLALMGLTYSLLPKLGYNKVSGKIPSIQPYIYGGGQLLHIIGLAWSGGYGALRKTPGAMETIEAKISMGFMGLGGMLSVIGGLFFVIVAFTSIIKSPINPFRIK